MTPDLRDLQRAGNVQVINGMVKKIIKTYRFKTTTVVVVESPNSIQRVINNCHPQTANSDDTPCPICTEELGEVLSS